MIYLQSSYILFQDKYILRKLIYFNTLESLLVYNAYDYLC